ncbi:MAG: hypothetical protein HFH82_05565 [Lachnospiraceae bacterium]|nr:hypothetical protein [Lachnospiraceae bacterium]
MLSRNLVKQAFVTSPQDEKRVIDNNALVMKRIGQLSPDGFVGGIGAEVLDMPVEEGAGNVIKASEDAETLLEEARKEAEAILNDARITALRMRDETRAETELEKNQILAQARQQGYDEGAAQARAELQAIEQEYQEKACQLEEAYQQQIDVLEPRFIDTITGIYEHIFQVDLGSYREILVHLIYTTIRKLEGSHDFMIHVSKEDYPYVSMQKKQMLAGAVSANCNVDVMEDSSLEKNQCMIETESGIYDCGLDTQMSELNRKLQLLAWSRE